MLFNPKPTQFLLPWQSDVLEVLGITAVCFVLIMALSKCMKNKRIADKFFIVGIGGSLSCIAAFVAFMMSLEIAERWGWKKAVLFWPISAVIAGVICLFFLNAMELRLGHQRKKPNVWLKIIINLAAIAVGIYWMANFYHF